MCALCPMQSIGSKPRFTNTCCVTGGWSKWQPPKRSASSFSICAAINALHKHSLKAKSTILRKRSKYGLKMSARWRRGEAAFAPISYLADTQQEPSEVLNARQFDRLQSEGLANALSMLDKRSRRIVKARWLDIEDDGSGGATLHELADEFGVSAERIRQIETSAMKRMKQALIPYVS